MRPNKDNGEPTSELDTRKYQGARKVQTDRLNTELGLVPCVHNVQLLDSGEANPIYAWRNRATYKWESPREEYVQSMEPVKMRFLALKWGVPQANLSRWCREGKWGLERQTFWNNVAAAVKNLNQESIAQTRTIEMSDRLAMWRSMKSQMFATLMTGVVREMSAKGMYIERPLNPGDYKDITAALSKIDLEIDKAMGIAGWVSKSGESDTEGLGITRITNVAFNFAGAPTQINTTGMANESALAHDAVEGEVVEPKALPEANNDDTN